MSAAQLALFSDNPSTLRAQNHQVHTMRQRGAGRTPAGSGAGASSGGQGRGPGGAAGGSGGDGGDGKGPRGAANDHRYNFNTQKGAQTLDHRAIRFSQTSTNDVSELVTSMKAKGWDGPPIDVVKMPDGSLITMDNTRLLAASWTNTPVKAIIHDSSKKLSEDFSRRFTTKQGGVPKNWGEAVQNRINKQNSVYRNTYPEGSYTTGSKQSYD